MTEQEFTAEARKHGIPDNEAALAFTDFKRIQKYVPDIPLQDFLATVKKVLKKHKDIDDDTVTSCGGYRDEV